MDNTLHPLTIISRDHGKAVAILANRLYREMYRPTFGSTGTAYACARDHALSILATSITR